MLLTLIQKEILHHVLSARFVALLLMCVLLIPLTLYINYLNYLQSRVNYQETIKLARSETKENPPDAQNPNVEVSKLFLEPTPLSVFAKGLEESLPSYLGMSRNGIKQGSTALAIAPISSALGHLDFLFVVGTVFSLLALLFTFDAVSGEKEAGTLRITLANALARDILLWSKLIGGYLVFVVPFLASFLLGLLLLTWQGFPLGDPDILLRVLSLTVVSLLYIGVFFAMGLMISTYLDSSKTALIVAFAFWVLASLIAPRTGFLVAKLIAPTRAMQSVHMEKTAIRNNLNQEMQGKINKKIFGTLGTRIDHTPEMQEKLAQLREPIEAEYRLKIQKRTNKIEREYQREKERQEFVGETLSRITPTSALIYLSLNLAQTGKIKRDTYFQTGTRYYNQLDAEYFSQISDNVFAQISRFTTRLGNPGTAAEKIAPPPVLTDATLEETLRESTVDLLLLCFFAVVLTTVAFWKFFHSDI